MLFEWFGQRLNFQEDCDDGNTLAGDGCDEMCRVETLWRLRVPLCDQQPLQQHSAAISAPFRGARRFALIPLHVPASGMVEVSVISINLVI